MDRVELINDLGRKAAKDACDSISRAADLAALTGGNAAGAATIALAFGMILAKINVLRQVQPELGQLMDTIAGINEPKELRLYQEHYQ